MLLKIRDYIKKSKVVSSQQVSREFHIDERALEPMLGWWVKKGVIRECDENGCKKSCNSCGVKKTSFYMMC